MRGDTPRFNPGLTVVKGQSVKYMAEKNDLFRAFNGGRSKKTDLKV